MNSISIINGFNDRGNRFLISTAIGFQNLGWKVNWIGNCKGGFDKLNLCYLNPREIWPNLNFNATLKDIESSDIILFNFGAIPEEEREEKWLDYLNSNFPNKFFLFDDNDYWMREWGRPRTKDYKYKVYLKRETSFEEYPDIYPFVGISTHPEWSDKQAWKHKTIWISCLFGPQNGNIRVGYHRNDIIQELKILEYSLDVINERIGAFKFLDKEYGFLEYLDIIGHSSISVSCWGAGFTCYRDFEILSNETLLAFKRMPNPYLNELKGISIDYETKEELIEKIGDITKRELLNRICAQKVIVQKLHTPEARAKEIISLNELKDVSNESLRRHYESFRK